MPDVLTTSQSKLRLQRLWQILFSGINLSPLSFTVIVALVLTTLYNQAFYAAIQRYDVNSSGAMLVLLFLVNLLLCSIFSYRRSAKFSAALFIIIAASSQYFMLRFGIVIDKDMLQNVLETDVKEASALISADMLQYAFGYVLIPLILLWKLNINWHGWRNRRTPLISAITLLLVLGVVLSNFQNFASTFRNHRDFKHLATPLNAISAMISVGNKTIAAQFPVDFKQQGLDAVIANNTVNSSKPNLIIFVLGETARADHFGINGYARNTTPLLSQQQVISLQKVSSCGTATAQSVPCMFSNLNRADYNESIAKNSDNFLDIMQRANIDVLWRDNNSGCKGMCDRVPTENLFKLPQAFGCDGEYCADTTLLKGLAERLQRNKPQFVVLHQLGSHGPEYYKRSAPEQKQFLPECTTNQLGNCSQQDIINAYDNSIVVTDILLNDTIELLKTLSSDYNTAMIYVSDHGESLGENGIYLHGMPYWMAPESQTTVPMIMWFSEQFKQANHLNQTCIEQLSKSTVSHDNLFDSMLGLMQVQSTVIRPEQNLFHNCKQQ